MRLMLILALVRMRIRSRSRRKIRPFGIFFLGKWVVDIGRQYDEAKSAGRRMKGEMGDTYFHFPPLPFNFAVSRPMYVAYGDRSNGSVVTFSHCTNRVRGEVTYHASSVQILTSAHSVQSNRRNLLYPQISSTEHIHPLKSKARKHLYTPSTQATYSYKFLNKFLVAGTD
jgi:hypothetical protein